jgi:excisionase family DNA binding protein
MAHSHPTAGRRWATIAAAADYLGLSVSGTRKLLARGLIPHSRLGRIIRVDLRALETQLEAQLQQPPSSRRVGR